MPTPDVEVSRSGTGRQPVAAFTEVHMRRGRAMEKLPEGQRKELFHVLVIAQDLEMTVAESRQMVCERFGIPETRVRRIEQEGLDRGWPPL